MGTNARWRRKNVNQVVWLVLLIAALYGAVTAFGWYRERGDKFPVQFQLADGQKTAPFYLDIADTNAKRMKGLMFVRPEDLPRDEGMLFVFPAQVIQSFWMKDTYTSLDIIFINENLEVVGVVENTTPLSLEQRRVQRPSRYVVELHAGTAKEKRIAEGAKLIPLRTIPVAQ